MAGFLCTKMKRKDFEQIYDDFSEFSLSSPATKIRRLDAELPPIMEDEELRGPVAFDQMLPEEELVLAAPMNAAAAAAATPCLPVNEERALVLYKPMETPLLRSPSSPNLKITVHSDFIPDFKSYLTGDRSMLKPAENESSESTNRNCLAVVPWVSSQSQVPIMKGSELKEVTATECSAPMEAEEVDNEGQMEIDMDNPEEQALGIGGFGEAQQWNQQHCMAPELPQNTSTPIMWSW